MLIKAYAISFYLRKCCDCKHFMQTRFGIVVSTVSSFIYTCVQTGQYLSNFLQGVRIFGFGIRTGAE